MPVANSLSPLPLSRYILERRLWGDRPLFVIDVGASGGVQDHWRVFGGHLRAVGFDPLLAEIDRLNSIEPDAGVHYEAAYVGCRDFDERFPPELRRNRLRTKDNDPWGRLSAARAQQLHQQSDHQTYVQQVFNAGAPVVRTDRMITLDEYIPARDREQVDFVKIDTDGHDIEVLLGAEQLLEADGVLGVSIESPFHGAIHTHANSFRNIDRLMRERGFTLFDFEPHRYSRAALPATFVYDLPAQTRSGQVVWAEATYFRDLGDSAYESLWRFTVTAERVLKLACLFEVFGLPDCAAELLVTRGAMLGEGVRDTLLDLLAGGQPGAYSDYIRRFEDDYTSWYPREAVAEGSSGPQAADENQPPPATVTPTSASQTGSTAQRGEAAPVTPSAWTAMEEDFNRLRLLLSALQDQHAAVEDRLRRATEADDPAKTE